MFFSKDKQVVFVRDMGVVEYQEAWDLQQRLQKELIDHKLANREKSTKDYTQNHYFLFCEHPSVYTLGRGGDADNLLINEEEMREKNIQYFPINRGGDITFHGLGQIVGYPILDLDFFTTDVHVYVRNIEEIVIRTLAEYGLEGKRIKDYTGVWLIDDQTGKKRKICAIGVHMSRWVTLHGFAFNINTDLQYFNYIVPCGITDKNMEVTTLSLELGRKIDQEEVKEKLLHHFGRVFECDMLRTVKTKFSAK